MLGSSPPATEQNGSQLSALTIRPHLHVSYRCQGRSTDTLTFISSAANKSGEIVGAVVGALLSMIAVVAVVMVIVFVVRRRTEKMKM